MPNRAIQNRAIALSLAALAAVAGCWSPPGAARAATQVAPAKALAKYRAAMADLPKPANMVFTYYETRSGPTRIVSGMHRVYRDRDGNQRNDTLAVNDFPIRPPRTQTFVRASWPYFADQFAVMSADYDVKFAGVAVVTGRRAYVYTVKRLEPAGFAVNELALDPSSGLPLRELYTVSTRDCAGSGAIDFMQIGDYVLPSSVWAACTMSGTGQFKDWIRFSNYSFPAAIPQEVLHPSGAATG
jgi:hypothetical protein